jgi:hypothetical protein
METVMSGVGTGPAPQRNMLRDLKVAAADRAEDAVYALAPSGGNPLSAVLASLQNAWTSSSHERVVFAENLQGAGLAIGRGLGSQGACMRAEGAHEPAQVHPDDPREGWKADQSRITARVSSTRYARVR